MPLAAVQQSCCTPADSSTWGALLRRSVALSSAPKVLFSLAVARAADLAEMAGAKVHCASLLASNFAASCLVLCHTCDLIRSSK